MEGCILDKIVFELAREHTQPAVAAEIFWRKQPYKDCLYEYSSLNFHQCEMLLFEAQCVVIMIIRQ